MEKRQLGKTDMQVSVLGFGGAEIGFEKASPEVVSRLLREALDAGLNIIDTAECYPDSEELIGQAVADRRDQFYLFTKCGHPESYEVADWRPESLLHTIERSLRRLKTSCVDLVQLHSCSEQDLRKGDVIAALEQARAKGHTRYIGYSGDGGAARFAIESGAFDTLQTSLSVADQEAIELTLPLARERQVGVIVKRPIGNAVWRYAQKPANGYIVPYWERLQKLDYEFLRTQPEHAASIALRFTLSQAGVHTAIVGTANPTRWRQNAALLAAGPLDADLVASIRKRWKEAAGGDWVGLT
jgi:aryl-alcohol dehydrogenase-like predicted oxidoreductase